MKNILLSFLLHLIFLNIYSQHETIIKSLKNEFWWGGAIAHGSAMPYISPLDEYNLLTQNSNNQIVPFMLSNKGRYIWSELPFKYSVSDNNIIIKSDYEKIDIITAGKTLKDAYMRACDKYFKPEGTLPDTLFFTMPQYNTWIELMYNQNQEDILKYANDIIDNGFPKGILMIDDNWQRYYGNFDFRKEKFPDPKAMVDSLHNMGFKVMLWVSPFVSADSQEYREYHDKGYLIKNRKGKPAILSWWNGQSACFDLTNPEASAHIISLLKKMQQEFGIDGFKFDAGDNSFYNSDIICYKKDAIAVDHTKAWAKIGLEFPFNEMRACWKLGGKALVQRLGDKQHSWKAISALIPEMIAAGLMGYSYTCPDMIGGGQYKSFHNVDPRRINQNQIVRSAQIHAMMPMMQFSVAPWRVLSPENMAITRDMALLHEKMGAYIMKCAGESALSGEPIVRHMEYEYPGQGLHDCKDQYMLGDRYMIAPVITNAEKRDVRLPVGLWKDDMGVKHKGGRTIEIDVPLSRLPYFEKIK